MYKIKDRKIKVFQNYFAMREGTYTIKVNTETGALTDDPNADGDDIKDVVTYTLDEDGKISITNLLPDVTEEGEAPTKARSWMNGRMISSGPLYAKPDGVGGGMISVFLEGFAFDFTYTAVVSSAMAIKPFKWVGGRVCTQDAFGNGDQSASNGRWTAIPASGSCGMAYINENNSGEGALRDVANFYGANTNSVLGAASRNQMEYYGNATSIVFSYRSFRKYVNFARGMSGLFHTGIGPIGGTGAQVEPEGNYSDPKSKKFTFSMFNLKQ